MRVPLRGSDVRRKFIGDEFQGRVVREVEGAALEMRFASNRRNVGSNPMLSAHFLNKNSTAVFTCPVLFLYVNDVPGYFHADPPKTAMRIMEAVRMETEQTIPVSIGAVISAKSVT